MLRVFDNTFALCATLKLYHRPDTGITCIASDTSNEYFVTGDAIGFVTVFHCFLISMLTSQGLDDYGIFNRKRLYFTTRELLECW